MLPRRLLGQVTLARCGCHPVSHLLTRQGLTMHQRSMKSSFIWRNIGPSRVLLVHWWSYLYRREWVAVTQNWLIRPNVFLEIILRLSSRQLTRKLKRLTYLRLAKKLKDTQKNDRFLFPPPQKSASGGNQDWPVLKMQLIGCRVALRK